MLMLMLMEKQKCIKETLARNKTIKYQKGHLFRDRDEVTRFKLEEQRDKSKKV